MDTKQLLHILKQLCDKYFVDVFPSNHLPVPKYNKSTLFVANTDTCREKGQHWICIYIGVDRNGEFFDSYGRSPEEPFRSYLNKYCKYWTFNKKQLQSIASNVCGHYCIFYCAYRCREFGLNDIISWFSSDTGLNDALVYNFVCNRLKVMSQH